MSNSMKYMLLALLVVVLAMLGLGAMSVVTLPGPLASVNGLLKESDEPAATTSSPTGGAQSTTQNDVPDCGTLPAPGATSTTTTTPTATTEAGAVATPPATGTVTGTATTQTNAAAEANSTAAEFDPCTGQQIPGTGTAPTTGAPGTTPSNPGAPTTPIGAATANATTDGTHSGNSAEALRIAAEVGGVLQVATIQTAVTATLVPGAGGVADPTKVAAYRKSVTGAVLVIKLVDPANLEKWNGAPKATRVKLVKGFFTRLAKQYPKATRSITVVDTSGAVLAVGDAAPRSSGSVRVL